MKLNEPIWAAVVAENDEILRSPGEQIIGEKAAVEKEVRLCLRHGFERGKLVPRQVSIRRVVMREIQ